MDLVIDEGQAGVTGDVIPSNQENGEKHYVSPKKTDQIPNDFVVLKARGTGEELFEELLEWETDPPSNGSVDPDDPTKFRVKRDTAGKTVVKIKVKDGGQEVQKMNVWVVWTTTQVSPAEGYLFFPVPSFENATGWKYDSSPVQDKGWRFVFTIQPQEITDEDGDIPDSTGEDFTEPPGHNVRHFAYDTQTNTPDRPGDHAQFKWDLSRQAEGTIVNAGLIPKNNSLLFLYTHHKRKQLTRLSISQTKQIKGMTILNQSSD